jgi:hypothetical protein
LSISTMRRLVGPKNIGSAAAKHFKDPGYEPNLQLFSSLVRLT